MIRSKNSDQSNSEENHYTFILFVIKGGENSERAKKNLKNICEKWISGRYDISVVDVVDDFNTALEHNILLTPSVVITQPEPKLVIHGDLSNPDKLERILNSYDEEVNAG